MEQAGTMNKTKHELDNHAEGNVTKMIEERTVKIPSGAFLALAIGAGAISLGVELFSRNRDRGSFVAAWVPTILLLGLYNKLVKVEGHEAPIYH